MDNKLYCALEPHESHEASMPNPYSMHELIVQTLAAMFLERKEIKNMKP
jgi:hypothetical protein